jgi:hypothetical protein
MERVNTTGSTVEQTDAKFYLPASYASTALSRAEQVLTTLFRSRDELRTLVRAERR